MRWGDLAALDEAIAITEKAPDPKPIWPFTGYEDDAVTTMNLILEGKRLSWMRDSRLPVVIQLANLAHLSSLPYLIGALDDSNPEIQWHALRGAKGMRDRLLGRPRIRERYLIDDFYDKTKGPLPNARKQVSEKGNRLLEEMKQWWAAEGKAQYERRLPKR
jgi:HEAT repeat protein